MNNKIILLLSALLLAGCGDGDSGGGGTVNNDSSPVIIPNDTPTSVSSSPADVDSFIPTNGTDSYRLAGGANTQAFLNSNNALSYVSLLFSPALRAPGTMLRAATPVNGLQLADADFMRAQEKLLAKLKQQALLQHRYQQRAVDISDRTACRNGGNVRLVGQLYDDIEKGKLKLIYNNCETGGYRLQGDAFLLIYAINGGFNNWSSATLSYNNMQAVTLSNNESVLFNGTIDEVNDINTGSTRITTKLHRQSDAAGGEQTLTDTVRQFTGANGSVAMSGYLYGGVSGWVELNTQRSLVYNEADAPVDGYITFAGAGNSTIAVTALGEQYDVSTDRNVILLQVDVDQNGDGFVDQTTKVATGDL